MRQGRLIAAGVALGLVLSLVVLLIAGRLSTGRHGERVVRPLLPECDGELAEVVLHWVPKLEPLVADTYTDFLQAMGGDVRLIVVVPSQITAGERARLDERVARIDPSGELIKRMQVVQTPGPITTWSKDRALVTSKDAAGLAQLIAPAEPERQWAERYNDWLTVRTVAAWSGGRFVADVAPFEFDAGDLMVDGDQVIIDTNLLAKNTRRGINGAGDLQRRVSAWLGMRVIMLGSEVGETPRHHLAMWMTTLTERVVLVGDPKAGEALVGASFDPQAVSPDTGEPLRPDFSPLTTNRFERAAQLLASHGYRVVRIPTVPFDDKTYLTYTNGIYEVRDGRRIAYVPQYGVEKLDAAARRIYAELDWQVRPVRVGAVYPYHGTIGCLINVLGRR